MILTKDAFVCPMGLLAPWSHRTLAFKWCRGGNLVCPGPDVASSGSAAEPPPPRGSVWEEGHRELRCQSFHSFVTASARTEENTVIGAWVSPLAAWLSKTSS